MGKKNSVVEVNILDDKPPWNNCADYAVEGKLPEDDGRPVTSHERFIEMVSRRAPY